MKIILKLNFAGKHRTKEENALYVFNNCMISGVYKETSSFLIDNVSYYTIVHFVKSVRIRSFSGPLSVRIRENTDQKTPNTDAFLHSGSLIAKHLQKYFRRNFCSIRISFLHTLLVFSYISSVCKACLQSA